MSIPAVSSKALEYRSLLEAGLGLLLGTRMKRQCGRQRSISPLGMCLSLTEGLCEPPRAEHLLQLPGSVTEAGSLQTCHSRVALLVNPCLFGVSCRLGGSRAAQPGCVGAFAQFGGSLQRSRISRARAAQTAESRSISPSRSRACTPACQQFSAQLL